MGLHLEFCDAIPKCLIVSLAWQPTNSKIWINIYKGANQPNWCLRLNFRSPLLYLNEGKWLRTLSGPYTVAITVRLACIVFTILPHTATWLTSNPFINIYKKYEGHKMYIVRQTSKTFTKSVLYAPYQIYILKMNRLAFHSKIGWILS